jgi:DNA-binding transcriptional ArsR family regulator
VTAPSGHGDDAFRAVSDPTRRAILDALAHGEHTVSELCALCAGITQSAVSQHLRVLRDAGLVQTRALGRHRFYRLDARPLRAVHDWAGHYQRFWTQKLEGLGAVLDREAARQRRRRRSS